MIRYSIPLPPYLSVFIVLSVFSLGISHALAQETGTKKLIYYGWGIPDTHYVRNHWSQMEGMPFDGVGIIVAVDSQAWQQGQTATDNQLGWQVMGRRRFHVDEFLGVIAELKSAKWHTIKDIFLPVVLSSSVSAAALDWFDDERWGVIVNNFGVVARIAAEGNVKGLILDPEHYGYALFSYQNQRQQIKGPFNEFAKIARQRGREVMTTIAASFPNVVLLSLYAYTLPLSELQRGINLEKATYGLLPTFYDGLLEAMPTGARLVDGYEFAYPFKKRKQFLEGYRQIHEGALRISGVPDIYEKRVIAGFGVWLDYNGRSNYFTPEEFGRTVSYALQVSDGYVWIYSQGPRFFPPSPIAAPYIKAIAEARAIRNQ